MNVISVFVMGFLGGVPMEKQEQMHFEGVEKYVNERSNRMKYTVAVDDANQTIKKAWQNASGEKGVPKLFLVDKLGRIVYIGSASEEFLSLLDDVVNEKHSLEELIKAAREKEAKNTVYDRTRPLLHYGNGGHDTAYMYRSLLAKYKGDIKAGRSQFMLGNRKMVQEVGADLSYLYHLAYGDTISNRPGEKINSYGKSWPELILEIGDKTPFEFEYKKPDNRWNYSLIVPEKLSAGSLQEIIQRDMKTYFKYDVNVEIRKMPCWILTATKKAKKSLKAENPGNTYSIRTNDSFVTSIKNARITDLIKMLQRSNRNEPPFIDKTGINNEFDIELKGNLRNFEELKKALQDQGIVLKKGKKPMKVIVVRDSK